MKDNKKTFILAICITALFSILITLFVLYGLQWLPKGTVFSFDTLGVFLGVAGSFGAIITIWFTTRKQLDEQKQMQKQNVKISFEQNEIQKLNLKVSEEQKEIQKWNVKLTLFDRRLEIYTAINKFIALIITNNSCTYEGVTQLNRDCRDAKWFFEEDITEYITFMGEKGRRLAFLNEIENVGTKDRSKVLDEQESLMDWFTQQMEDIVNIFDRYLNVNNIGNNQ